MSNKVYDILKWILLVAVAPTIALITGLGELYGFDTTLIVGTISLVATFLGALLGVSNVKYNKRVDTNENIK
jgi:hypothetical protein